MPSGKALPSQSGAADGVLLNRRRFLSRSSVVLSAALTRPVLDGVSQALARERDVSVSQDLAWAVAYVGRRYVGLFGTEDVGYELRAVETDTHGRMFGASRLGIELPATFVPSSLHGVRDSLFVLGGQLVEYDHYILEAHGSIPEADRDGLIETDDPGGRDRAVVPLYTLVPSLIEVGAPRKLHDLSSGRAARGAWGVAVAMVSVGDGHVVLVEGSESVEASYGDEVWTVATADDGVTWSSLEVVRGLGDGYGTTLVDLGNALAVVAVDFRRVRTVHRAAPSPHAPWHPQQPMQGRGPLHTAIAGGPEQLRLFQSEGHFGPKSGVITTAVFDETGQQTSSWEGLRIEGRDVIEVIPVSGQAGAWVGITDVGQMHLVA